MKISITLILILILSSSAWGYSKKIIFSSFSSKQNAEKALENFLNTPKKSQKLITLAEKNEFKVHIRQSGKYYIMVAEPITNKILLSKTIKIVKKSYKQAYANKYTPPIVITEVPDELLLEKTQELNVSVAKEKIIQKKAQEVVKEVQEVEVPLHPSFDSSTLDVNTADINRTKNETFTEPLESNVSVNKEIETLYKEDKIDLELLIKWLLLFVVVSVIIFYFIKFKRIYDEY